MLIMMTMMMMILLLVQCVVMMCVVNTLTGASTLFFVSVTTVSMRRLLISIASVLWLAGTLSHCRKSTFPTLVKLNMTS